LANLTNLRFIAANGDDEGEATEDPRNRDSCEVTRVREALVCTDIEADTSARPQP